jgi:hypothetical protein
MGKRGMGEEMSFNRRGLRGGIGVVAACCSLAGHARTPQRSNAKAIPGTVDVHLHFYPKFLMDAWAAAPLESDGTPQSALSLLDDNGMATAVLSLPTGTVGFLRGPDLVRMVRQVNEYATRLAHDQPGHVVRIATCLQLPAKEPHIDLSLIHYANLGDTGPRVVMVHGGGQGSVVGGEKNFRNQFHLAEEGWQLIVPDRPGHGHSLYHGWPDKAAKDGVWTSELRAKGADLLVSVIMDPDAALAQLRHDRPDMPGPILEYIGEHFRHGHMSANEAGLIASRAGIKSLVLTHNSIATAGIPAAQKAIKVNFKCQVRFPRDIDVF